MATKGDTWIWGIIETRIGTFPVDIRVLGFSRRPFVFWLVSLWASEPTIGHLKSDHRLSRNHLKGRHGDRANVLLAAAGYNFAKLLAGFSRAWRKFREIYFWPRPILSLRDSALPGA